MDPRSPEIVLLSARVETAELARLVAQHFGDMVKLVVDVDRGIVALGGQLHADAEKLLLDAGSAQASLWGANYYPGRGAERCLEYTSLINIRPAEGNPSMEIEDLARRARVRELAFALVGTGEKLP